MKVLKKPSATRRSRVKGAVWRDALLRLLGAQKRAPPTVVGKNNPKHIS
jgi:hypothetical protein